MRAGALTLPLSRPALFHRHLLRRPICDILRILDPIAAGRVALSQQQDNTPSRGGRQDDPDQDVVTVSRQPEEPVGRGVGESWMDNDASDFCIHLRYNNNANNAICEFYVRHPSPAPFRRSSRRENRKWVGECTRYLDVRAIHSHRKRRSQPEARWPARWGSMELCTTSAFALFDGNRSPQRDLGPRCLPEHSGTDWRAPRARLSPGKPELVARSTQGRGSLYYQTTLESRPGSLHTVGSGRRGVQGSPVDLFR